MYYYKNDLLNNIFSFEEHSILNNEKKIGFILKELNNEKTFLFGLNNSSYFNYFQSEKIKTLEITSLHSLNRYHMQEISAIFNLSSSKELPNLGYCFGNKNYFLLFKPLSYETQYLYSYEIHKPNCISIKNNEGFKDSIKFGYCKSDHLSYKEVFGNINHIERIKYIALILQHAGFLFEIISLDDFILNPILGICLSRYRHIKQLDKKVPHILRCPKCHSPMELDLEPFRKVLLRTMEAHYSCPKCKASNSYTKMLKTYETNIRNSYKQGGIL